jgi:hypothetical protein
MMDSAALRLMALSPDDLYRYVQGMDTRGSTGEGEE